jgi:LEA14-like dessication related protein
MDSLRSLVTKRRIAGALVALVVLLGVFVAAGVFGTPSVVGVENRFAGVSEETTTVESDLTIRNPNPIGVRLGSANVAYTVLMNDVNMATGGREGVRVTTGNSTLTFTTRMQNDRIPRWWFTHVDAGERTQVTIDATVSTPLLGGQSVALSQNRTVETDVIGQFNSSETRPVDANTAVVEDPILYINQTNGSWDRAALSEQRTPMTTTFELYNPKAYPYAITEIGYTIRMNDVTVGAGSTGDPAVLDAGETTTVTTTTTIDNSNLDEWWVSHLENDQTTTLVIDFYAVVDPQTAGLSAVEPIRVDLEAADYETTIETDIFGNKEADSTESGDDGTSGDSTADGSETTGDSGSRSTSDGGGSTDDGQPADDGQTTDDDDLLAVAPA